MKRFLSLLTIVSMMTIAAFAADAGSGSVRLNSAVRVGSQDLPAGTYKVTWTGSGDTAQVTFKQGKTSITAPAQVIDGKHSQDAYATKAENGTRVLTEIQFRDKSLVFNNGSTAIAGQ